MPDNLLAPGRLAPGQIVLIGSAIVAATFDFNPAGGLLFSQSALALARVGS
jgi:hypothetical protein